MKRKIISVIEDRSWKTPSCHSVDEYYVELDCGHKVTVDQKNGYVNCYYCDEIINKEQNDQQIPISELREKLEFIVEEERLNSVIQLLFYNIEVIERLCEKQLENFEDYQKIIKQIKEVCVLSREIPEKLGCYVDRLGGENE